MQDFSTVVQTDSDSSTSSFREGHAQPWLRAWGQWLFSNCPNRALRIRRSLLAAQVYLAGIWVSEYALRHWDVDVPAIRGFQICSVLGSLLFYLLLRTGWSERLQDPSLTAVQIVFAQTMAAWAYSIVYPVRGALLLLQFMVVYFSLFKLKQRGQLAISCYGLLIMGFTMLLMNHLQPGRFVYQNELVHFVILATTLPSVTVLGQQLTSMRQRMKRQQIDLQDAVQRIQELAHRDELTGLYNRRYMLDMVRQHAKLHGRSERPLCLALIDLDHFKRVNDQFGHHIGDDVLRAFAHEARTALRETDLLARWGGEEFLLLIPDTDIEHASRGIERFRTRLRHTPITPEAPALRTMFSAGLTQFQPDDCVESVIERADKALYEAKERGRNCTVTR